MGVCRFLLRRLMLSTRTERARRQRERDPEGFRAKSAESARRWRERNPEKARDVNDRYRSANRNKVLETQRSSQRRRRAADLDTARARERTAHKIRMHGPGFDDWFAEQWQAQDGRCYLHGGLMVLDGPTTMDSVVVDHDHTCCGPERTCSYCRRGLACRRCNWLIGHVFDDPAILRQIADNLDAVLKVTRHRIAMKPAQMELEAG